MLSIKITIDYGIQGYSICIFNI